MYLTFTKSRTLSGAARKEAFKLLIHRSLHNERASVKSVALDSLTRHDAKMLLNILETVAGAEGWGFPFKGSK